MKKLLTVVLAVMLLVSVMVVPAFAADSYTITIENEAENHEYQAYQVFTGSLSATGVLSDVQWGAGVNGDAVLAALKANTAFVKGDANLFAACSTAEDVARVISAWSYNESNIKTFAEVVAANLTTTTYTSGAQADDQYVITVDAAGYYLIKESGSASVEGFTDYLLQVVKNVEVTPKVSQPTFNKTVNTSESGTYTKAVDVQNGDTVYYKLEITLPSLYNDYKQFHLHITDLIPDGFTVAEGYGKIYILHASGATTDVKEDVKITHTPATETSKHTMQIDFGNIKDTSKYPALNLNDTIVIKYHAVADKTAGIIYGQGEGGLGNINTATLKFSNDMNQEEPKDSEGKVDHDAIHTATISSTASVYVYQLQVKKVDSITKAPLANAQFYLYRNVTTSTTGTDNTTTTETVKHYAHTDANGVITSWKAWSDTDKPAVLTSGEDGTFTIKGLDALAYHLEEVKAPDGYNKMDEDVLVTVSSTITDQNLTALSCTADGSSAAGDVSKGLVAISVNNTAGTTLPETGGMGTTIFYIAGGILILGAAVILLARKRKEA